MEDAKPFWTSKTLWVNGVSVVAALLAAVGVVQLDAEFQAEIVVVVMGVVNMALRFITKEPVSM